MTWKTIQENEICKTMERETKNGTLFINIDTGATPTVIYPGDNTYGLASPVQGCDCLKEVGHVRIEGANPDFLELDSSSQLICLANGIAGVTGRLAVMGDIDEATWGCFDCVLDCPECGQATDDCDCEDPDSDTFNCGCCKCCSCRCDDFYDNQVYETEEDEA